MHKRELSLYKDEDLEYFFQKFDEFMEENPEVKKKWADFIVEDLSEGD